MATQMFPGVATLVPLYIILDQEKEGRPRSLRGYRRGKKAFEEERFVDAVNALSEPLSRMTGAVTL